MAKLRRGDSSVFITNAVLRPLVERGYLTWREAGFTGDPQEGGTRGWEWYARENRTPGDKGYAYNLPRGRSRQVGTINGRVQQALVQFQQDNGISHTEDVTPQGLTRGPFEYRDQREVSSGVVGRRTLEALGQSTMDPDTQRLVAMNMRRQAAKATIQKGGGEAISQRINDIRQSYPDLDARVTAALALTGHGLEDPVTKSMVQFSMQKDAKPAWQRDAWADIPHERGDRNPLVDELGNQIVDPSGELTPFTPPQHDQQQGGGSSLSGPLGVFGAVPGVALDRIGELGGISQLGDAIRTPIQMAQDDVIKPAVRGTLTAFETPYQTLQGEFRNRVNAVTPAWQDPARSEADYMRNTMWHPPAGQSSGGIVAEHLLAGKPVDQGSGYFPGGQVAKEQAQRSRDAGEIAGHAITPGRYFASKILDPDSTAYDMVSGVIDAGAITAADPSNYALTALSDARAAGRVAQIANDGEISIPGRLAGLLPGVRRSVNTQTLDEALTRGVLTPIVEDDFTYGQYRKMFKGDSTTAALMARTTDIEDQAAKIAERRAILDPRLGITNDTLGRGIGTTIRDVPQKPYFWQRIPTDAAQNVRGFGMTPGNGAYLSDIDDAAEKVDRLMRTGKLTRDQRDTFGAAFVLSEGNERYGVIKQIENAMAKRAEDYGVDPLLAKERTRFFQDRENDRQWFNDLNTGDPINLFLDMGDEHFNSRHPGLEIDFMNDFMPMPDAREIRRMTSKWSQMSRPGYWKSRIEGLPYDDAARVGAITSGFERYVTKPWKGFTLIAPKTGLRVTMDEQARMAGDGYWDHPFHMLTSLLFAPKNQVDALGKNWIDGMEEAAARGDWTPYARARTPGWAEWSPDADKRLMKQAGYKVYERQHDLREFVAAWHDRIARMNTSEIGSYLAKNGENETKRWLREDEQGRELWDHMTKRALDPDKPVQAMPQIDTYVENLYDHLDQLTDHDPELMRVIGTGKWNDRPIAGIGQRGSPGFDPEFARMLRGRAEEGAAPRFMPGRKFVPRGADDVGRLDHFFDKVLNVTMSMPSNRFNRSPVFQKAYWNRLEEMAPMIDEATRRTFAENARKDGFDKIAESFDRVSPTSRTLLTALEADDIAKFHGVNAVRELLYDVGERTTVFDALRNLVPFGEAWKEVLTRWARIFSERPQNLRRLQVGVTGAQEAGFIYTDPSTKQQMFVWPGSEWASAHTPGLGVPIPIGGSVSGLNMVATGLPGVGPAIQIPLGAVLPNDPDWDWLRDAMDPYGQSDTAPGESKIENAVLGLTPAWARRFFQVGNFGPEKERMTAIGSMMSYLRTAHPRKYANDPGQLLEDAKSKSKAYWFMRMLGSAVLPTAPLPQFQVVDGKGRKHNLNEMKTIYYEGLQKADDMGKWDRKFIAKYGVDTWAEMTPITDTTGVPLPRTKSQFNWVRDNEWAAEKYPYVYGFFVPNDPDGKYDSRLADRALHPHERFTLTPEEQLKAKDDRVGWLEYNEQTAGLGNSRHDQELKRFIKQDIKDAYPGWMDKTGMPESVDRDRQLDQLRRAITDRRLRTTNFAKGMREYLDARDAVEAKSARGRGTPDTWKSSKRFRRERATLRFIAQDVQDAYPETREAFDTLFRDELQEEPDGR